MSKNLINTKFDPSQISLRDLMELYARDKKRNVQNFLGSLSAPEFKAYMDSPAIEFFEAARDENNPLQQYFDQQAAKGVGPGGAKKAFSAVKLLEENVVHQLKRLDRMGDYADDTNGFPKLTDTVVEPAKGQPRSKKLRINPAKYGELMAGLVEHARQNPKDVPVVRALMTQMYLGFRPKEILQMPMQGTIRDADEGSVSKGLFLPADLAKMDEAMSIPLSPHVESMLNSAIESNNSRFGNKEVPDLMFVGDDGKPLPKGSLSRVLKSITVPGILEDARTGEKFDNLTAAYDLRRGHATFVNMLGFSPQTGGEMKARAIKEAGGGEEPKYIAKPFGFFTAQQLGPHVALHNAILEVFARASGVEGAGLNKGIIIDPRQDIWDESLRINRLSDLQTMNVADMGGVSIPGATLPSNIVLPAEPDAGAAPATPKNVGDVPLSTLQQIMNGLKDPKVVGTGAVAGLTATSFITNPAEASTSIAAETTAETTTRAVMRTVLPKVTAAAGTGPMAPATIAAMVAAETVAASPGAGPGQLNVQEQMQLDLARQAGDIGAEKELMAREPITGIGGPDEPTVYGQRVTRAPSTEDLTFDYILKEDAKTRRRTRNEPVNTGR